MQPNALLAWQNFIMQKVGVIVGDLALVSSGSPRPMEVPRETPAPKEPISEVREAPGAEGASVGIVSVEVDDVGPQPGDDAGSSLQSLVMRGASIGVSRSAAPGDVTPAPGSLGAAGLGVYGLLLPGFPGFPLLHIDWRRVEDNAELLCLQVAKTVGLFHDTLDSVGWNIMRPIEDCLKKEKKACLRASGFLPVT
jgi:hypothetical protein